MHLTPYEHWLNIRDRINNKLIYFLIRHCFLNCHTCRVFVEEIPIPEIEIYIKEKRIRHS